MTIITKFTLSLFGKLSGQWKRLDTAACVGLVAYYRALMWDLLHNEWSIKLPTLLHYYDNKHWGMKTINPFWSRYFQFCWKKSLAFQFRFHWGFPYGSNRQDCYNFKSYGDRVPTDWTGCYTLMFHPNQLPVSVKISVKSLTQWDRDKMATIWQQTRRQAIIWTDDG